MLENFRSLFSNFYNWQIWAHFKLVESHTPQSSTIFDLPEFLTVLALFMIIVTNSDFRYSYRLSLLKNDIKKIGIWTCGTIGFSVLIVDIWFENQLPVPQILSNSNNIKAALGFVFLTFIFRVVFLAFIRPPQFQKNNAEKFFSSNFHLIHQGNTEKLQIIAEELRPSIKEIVKCAGKKIAHEQTRLDDKNSEDKTFAQNILLLIGDNRFCSTVVDRVPSFAIFCFQEAQEQHNDRLPIYQFAHNVGRNFITNTNSSFYQENSGSRTGLFGYSQPVTNTIFGNYEFVEQCTADGYGPLELEFDDLLNLSKQQIDGFYRASVAFMESYLIATKGNPRKHSYALARVIDSYEISMSETYKLEGQEHLYNFPAYRNLGASANFARTAMTLIEKHTDKPSDYRIHEFQNQDIFDKTANFIFEIILASTQVNSPQWTVWAIQHNAVWGHIFSFNKDKTSKIISLKVRRLMYDEVQEMNEFPNFKGARVLGFCLNIFGLELVNRHTGFRKEFYPLQAFILNWTKLNFSRLLSDHPKVAQTCLQGSITYDSKSHCLVKTFRAGTEKEPRRQFLYLN